MARVALLIEIVARETLSTQDGQGPPPAEPDGRQSLVLYAPP